MDIFTFIAAQVPDHDDQSAARYWDVVGFLASNLPGFSLVSRAVFARPRFTRLALAWTTVPGTRQTVCAQTADAASQL